MSERSENFLELFWVGLKFELFSFKEYLKTIVFYYYYTKFMRCDLDLLKAYIFASPFDISKKFHTDRKDKNIYVYGETPLTTLEEILTTCDISRKDPIYELGAGRGRGAFWMRLVWGAPVVAIEYISEFVAIARGVQKKRGIPDLEFRCEDMMNSDLSEAKSIYLYGTCFDEEMINKLCKKLSETRSGTKIITVSYHLYDYDHGVNFEVEKRFTATFPWGESDVYLHVRK